MRDAPASIVSKVWNYAHVLKNEGVTYSILATATCLKTMTELRP